MDSGDTKRTSRRLAKLEERLAAERETEAKRTRQAEKAQACGADARLAKRTRQREKATRRSAALETAIAELRGGTAANAAAGQVMGYCLHDRAMVALRDPRPMTLRNGRAATTGTCPRCGHRVMRLG